MKLSFDTNLLEDSKYEQRNKGIYRISRKLSVKLIVFLNEKIKSKGEWKMEISKKGDK